MKWEFRRNYVSLHKNDKYGFYKEQTDYPQI